MKTSLRTCWVIFASGLVLLLIAATWLLFKPAYVVRIENYTQKKMIHELPAVPGSNLWLIHINSVEKLPVAEHYKIAPDYRFVFSEVIYQAPYVGYRNEKKAKIVAPGTVRVTDFNTPMETVSFFAGDISKHLMFWNGTWLPLYEGADGGDLILIAIKKTSGLRLLFR